MANADIAKIPVFILCGGLGTRIKEETEFRPKPMVPVGGVPILLHIMRYYARFGFKRFILCLGFKGDCIKSYFLNYSSLKSDFTIHLKSSEVVVHSVDHEDDWEVTLADTGPASMTGARIRRAAEKYLGDAPFAAVTYGDGLCNANLIDELEFHHSHGKIGTVLGVNPPSRFGEIALNGDEVEAFREKPEFSSSWVNGGYFFFNRSFFFDYLSVDEGCILERHPLVQLAEDNQLLMYRNQGFWACMDTQRDREYLESLWTDGKAPWAAPLKYFPATSANSLLKSFL